jgi:hypothetical protein
MLEDRVPSAVCAEDHSADIEDLCEAMFLEGARVLGFAFGDQPISLDAQEKIRQAANALSEKLTLLAQMQRAVQCETELGN